MSNNTTNNFATGADPNNFVGVDTNGDGIIEQFVYDPNQDGSPEVRISSDTGFVPTQTSYDPSFGTTPAYQPEEGIAHTAHSPSFGTTPAYQPEEGISHTAHSPSFGTTPAYQPEEGFAHTAHSPSFGASDAAAYDSDFVATPEVPAPNFGYEIDLGDSYAIDANSDPIDEIGIDLDAPILLKIDDLASDVGSIYGDLGVDLPDDFNAYGMDYTDNGIIDTVAVDLGGDGTVDGVGMDLTEDGLFDVLGIDTDVDGVPDTFVVDYDNNGTLDDIFTLDDFSI